eukprot:jgi/Orpsp1_1/1174429/evm.model.c7180000050047.1
MFNWCMMKVQGVGATKLLEAQHNRENSLLEESDYLNLEEIKDVLLEAYRLKEDPEDIINKLKDMKIGTKDDIKTFNKQYENLYNKLDADNKCRITTNAYLDAIISKNHAWKSVKAEHKRKKISISEAMESVEFYDNIEVELKKKTRNGSNSNIASSSKNFKNSNVNKNFNNNTSSNNFNNFNNNKTNGLTENRNREIGKLLRTLGNKEKEWDLVLPFALWALRTAKNKVTKYSSFELLYGRRDQQPFELSTTLPTSMLYGSKEEQLIEKFINHYKWVIDACNNIDRNNQHWEVKREEIT